MRTGQESRSTGEENWEDLSVSYKHTNEYKADKWLTMITIVKQLQTTCSKPQRPAILRFTMAQVQSYFLGHLVPFRESDILESVWEETSDSKVQRIESTVCIFPKVLLVDVVQT